MSENFETVQYEVNKSVAIIKLNRPKQINSINRQLAIDLWNSLNLAEQDKVIKAVIITGSANNFSSGVDLKEVYDRPSPISDEPSEAWREHLEWMLKVSLKMWNHRVPIIVAVDGYALGAAADWVLSADIAIATDKAIFGEPEIRFGAAPPTLMLPWIVGVRKSKELLFTGDSIDANEAHRIGIFNKVVPQTELMDQSMVMAEKISNIPPSALKITKVSINKVFEMMNLKESLDYNLETAISMFFLKTEKDIADVGQQIKEEGLRNFLKNANQKFE